MYTRSEIQQMADRIKAGMNCRVFLFGSYAWGRPNACSDVDLAVVMPDDQYTSKSDVAARKLSQHGTIPIDIMAYRSTTFENSVSGTLSYEIRSKGVEL